MRLRVAGTDFSAIMEVVRETGGLEAARQVAIREAELAKQAIAILPKAKYQNALLELADYAVTRDR